MSDNQEPEVTGAPSADARSVEAVAEAVAGARGPTNFTLEAPPVGSRRPTGSPEHSQDIGDAVIEPLHADRGVQAIFAAQEGGMDLPFYKIARRSRLCMILYFQVVPIRAFLLARKIMS